MKLAEKRIEKKHPIFAFLEMKLMQKK